MKRIVVQAIGEPRVRVRPAPSDRDWMDRTPQRFAYRCLPLIMANAHGWEVLCPFDVRAGWDGGPHTGSVFVEGEAPEYLLPKTHFGNGIITFHVHALIKTDPGVQLWVGGSPNLIKDGIQPLTGLVETDWSPYTFTMNWKFTRPGTVEFKEGEPFCFFFPIQLELIESMNPLLIPIEQNPPAARTYDAWSKSRARFNQEVQVQGTQAYEEGWQKSYFKGQMPDGKIAAVKHRTKVRVPPFEER